MIKRARLKVKRAKKGICLESSGILSKVKFKVFMSDFKKDEY